jgi:hypothetical protein
MSIQERDLGVVIRTAHQTRKLFIVQARTKDEAVEKIKSRLEPGDIPVLVIEYWENIKLPIQKKLRI